MKAKTGGIRGKTGSFPRAVAGRRDQVPEVAAADHHHHGDLGLGATADGVAMGADGALYVAANLRGSSAS